MFQIAVVNSMLLCTCVYMSIYIYISLKNLSAKYQSIYALKFGFVFDFISQTSTRKLSLVI